MVVFYTRINIYIMVKSAPTPRRHITQLPAVLQTDTMAKYFASTVDQVFQPGKPERLSGYIGSTPSYYDPARDFYISEISTERAAHQLEPAMVSRDASNNVNALLVYNDYVEYLGMQNANTTNHTRLFSTDCYSWAPPVDPDKINNYQQYYWFGDAALLPAVELTAQSTTYIGDGITTVFTLPEKFSQFDVSLERVVAFVEQQSVAQFFRPSETSLAFYNAPVAGSTITLFRYGDLTKLISGKTGFDPRPFTPQPVSALTSTMKVVLSDARTLYSGWARTPWNAIIMRDPKAMWEVPSWDTVAYDLGFVDEPWGARDAHTSFWVDGVGSAIVLTPLTRSDADVTYASYVTIDRRSSDGNPWSLHNYWVHAAAFEWSGLSFPSLRARRPIIEFIPNLELYKYGTTRLDDITAVLTGDPYRAAQNYAPRPINDDIRWWDVLEWDVDADGGFEASALQRVPLAETNGSPIGSIYVDGQHSLIFGDRVLVIDNPNSALNNRIITIVKGDIAGDMLFQASSPPSNGDIVRIHRAATPWGTDYSTAPWDTSIIPEEYYFNGTTWVVAPSRTFISDPLFSLYTSDRVRHEDLPSSTFAGNRLFGFAAGGGIADTVLNRQLAFDNNGEIQFNNDIGNVSASSDGAKIHGLQFFRIAGGASSADVYGNDWHSYPVATSQAQDANGIWSFPINLTANPGNENVGLITQAQWFPQLSAGISAQSGFSGVPYGSNNWRDTQRKLGLGTTILQHDAPMLTAMLLAAKKPFDYFDAVRFVEHEYARFRAKFVQQLDSMLNTGSLRTTDDPGKWVAAVLAKLKTSKNNASPFSLSQMAGGAFYIPPTPASLGLFAPTRPEYVFDNTYSSPVAFIVGHDGSRTPAFLDWRDAVILTLEVMIYNNIDATFREEDAPTFDWWVTTGGRYRNKTIPLSKRYTHAELVDMYKPMFVAWAQKNNLDYMANAGHDLTDPFTYNFNGALDIDGNQCPGNWRAIYRHFFDTDQPHARPWEMLGFASQPEWWTAEYGPSPYTSGNLHLWNDLRDGIIRQGARVGIDSRFTRPDLLSILPVDSSGNLLDPVACGVVRKPKTAQSAAWGIGDHGPVENLWMNTPGYAFAKAQMACLMRPASWIAFAWDRGALVHRNGQWLCADTHSRPRPSEIHVHGEIIHGSPIVKLGIQQWISDMLVSRSQQPAQLGAAIRGLETNLVHRMGGFTQSSNLSVLADNFGIVPSEDVEVIFYQPPPTRQIFYSAMIIEWTGAGWRVIGYDVETQSFMTLPGDTRGPKTDINLGKVATIHDWKPNVYYSVGINVVYDKTVYQCLTANTSSMKFEPGYWTIVTKTAPAPISVKVCDNGSGKKISVPYGTIFTTYQEVSSFIRDYFRWMENEGFNFEEPDANGNINGWNENILEFLKWAQVNWQAGNFVALAPGASTLSFKADFGTIYNVEEPVNGVSGLLNRTARPILHKDAFVSRIGGDLKILVNNADLYGARLLIGEIEHTLIFSNTTIFGDVIYSPLLNLYQPRLKVNGIRSANWNGRMEAPGYVISGGNLMENFHKTTEDLREMFDIEQADVPYLRNFARHNIAFQPLSYLENLLISETEQFEFYQGMIQQKGAGGVFSALSRSQLVDQSADLKFLEEWALEIGSYGAVSKTSNLSFSITTDDISHDRQMVSFGETHLDDGVIGLPSLDPRWINRPETSAPFRMRAASAPPKLPVAGNVRLDEINYTIRTPDDLPSLYTLIQQNGYFGAGSTVWCYDRGDGSYDVEQAFAIGKGDVLIVSIQTATEDPTLNIANIRITFNKNHGLTSSDSGKVIYLQSTASYTSPDLGGFSTLYVETATTIVIALGPLDVSTLVGHSFATPTTFPMFIMRSVRFPDIRTAQSFWKYIFPAVGQMMWVDHTEAGRAVYKWAATGWQIVRQQPNMVDSGVIEMSRLYLNAPVIDAAASSLTKNPILLPGMTVYNPLFGFIPGPARNELNFICDSDPAQYYDTGSMWGIKQLGNLWWDTSAVKFLETEIDILDSIDPARNKSSLQYRVDHWGKIAPGTSVNIYEWTRVLSWPLDSSVNTSGSFLQTVEYDATINGYLSVFYTWVLNPAMVPDSPARTISALGVAAMILDPSASGLPWMSPITANSFIVSGISPYLGAAATAMEIYLSAPENHGVVHRQWQLSRPADEILVPAHAFWKALRSSLVGFDDSTNPVPSPQLPPSATIGIGPGQSMWPASSRLAARRAFVDVVNEILGASYLASTNTNLASQMTLTTPAFQNLIWERDGAFSGITPPPINSFDFVASSVKERAYISNQKQLLTTRAQTILNRNPRILLTNYLDGNAAWSVWEVDPVSGEMTLATNYDNTVATYADMTSGTFNVGTRILVLADENASGFWVIYAYLPGYTGANADGFVAVDIQTYNTSDFFSEANWFSSGFSATNPPIISYATIKDRDAAQGSNVSDEFVQIDDNGAGNWIWTKWSGTEWVLVAVENGTLALSSKFYDPSRVQWGGDYFDPMKVPMRDGSMEMRAIFDVLCANITPAQMNKIYYTMLNFVFAHQNEVAWAFKTSFLTVAYYRERLAATPIATPDNIDNLLAFVDDVKPYRVKVRDYIQSFLTDTDRATIHGADYDKPAYYDSEIGVYRPLDPSKPLDLAIMSQTQPWKDWMSGYLNSSYDPSSASYSPVRRIKTTVRFDRIDPGATPLKSDFGWDETAMDAFPFDDIVPEIDACSSAMIRMLHYYEPGLGMRAANAEIDFDLGFKGLVSNGTLAASAVDANLIDADNISFLAVPEKFADPTIEAGHPQEFATARSPDSLSLTVISNWTPGAPTQHCEYLDVAFNSGATTLDLMHLAATAQSVLTFIDGVLAPATAVEFSQFKKTISANIDSADRILMSHTVGVGGKSNIIDQRYFSGDGVTSTFSLGRATAYIDVAVNGVSVLPGDMLASSVTLDAAPETGADVMLTGYAAPTPTHVLRESLPYVSGQTWTLANPASGAGPASHFGTLIFVNGKVLSPPPTRCFVSPASSGVPFVEITDAATVNIWINGVLYPGVVGIAPPVSEAVFTGAEMVNSIQFPHGNPDFIITDGYFKINNPAITGEICIEYSAGGDFNVSGPNLSISNPLSPTDRIEAVTFVNADLMGISSQAFPGAPNGCYPIMVSLPNELGYVIVSVDGKVATPSIDYVVTMTPPMDFDEIGLDSFPFDHGIGATTVQFYNGHKLSQNIVITAFSGEPALPSSTWSSDTLETGLSLMGDQNIAGDWDNLSFDTQYDGMAPQYATSPLGERAVFQMNGTWDFSERKIGRTGSLANPLLENDTEITIALDSYGEASEMIPSNPFTAPSGDTPGVVMINGERIEYFQMQCSGVSVVLSEIRRGSKNTRIGMEQRSFARYTGDGATTSFTLATATSISAVEVIVLDGDGETFRYLSQNVDFTAFQAGPNISVVFKTAPLAGGFIAIAQSHAIYHAAGSMISAYNPGSRSDVIPFHGAYDFAA